MSTYITGETGVYFFIWFVIHTVYSRVIIKVAHR